VEGGPGGTVAERQNRAVNVHPEEWDFLGRAARKLGVGRTTFLRSVGLEAAAKVLGEPVPGCASPPVPLRPESSPGPEGA